MKNPFNDKTLNTKLIVALFVTYLWCIVWVIGLKFNADWIYELREYMLKLPVKSRVGNNWIPFYSLVKSIGDGTYSFNLDHLMNVVIYIPMGILVYLLTYKKMRYWAVVVTVLSLSAVTSIIFEVVQLYTGIGGCDGTDFACNFFGGGVGLLLMIILRRLKNFEQIANIVSFCCILVAVPLGVYMLVNTILCAGQYAPI